MALAMARLEVVEFASELGPSVWTIENWKGVGFVAVAFFVLLWGILRAARPGRDSNKG